jgi:hypothetical protein
MNNLKFLIIILMMTSCANHQMEGDKTMFLIRFDSCFDNDSVSLYLNNIEIFKSIKLKTDDVVGITPIYLLYSKSSTLKVFYKKDIIIQNEIDLENKIDVTVLLNDVKTTETIEMSKGKNITIDACTPDYKVNIHQYKKKVVYD